jgi:hypothetical protein
VETTSAFKFLCIGVISDFKYFKPNQKANKIKRIPPRAAPITTPMDTPFEPVLVTFDVVT